MPLPCTSLKAYAMEHLFLLSLLTPCSNAMAALGIIVRNLTTNVKRFVFIRRGKKDKPSFRRKLLDVFALVMGCFAGGGLTWFVVRKYKSLQNIYAAATYEELYGSPVLIKNGIIVNAQSMLKNDIYIKDGMVKKIGKNLPTETNTVVIDAKGMYVLPGGIDPHTHMEFKAMGISTADDFFTGTRAALAGGTTSIIDLAIPAKGESLIKTYSRYREIAEKACCDYGIHVGVTWWSDKVEDEMQELSTKHGVNSFKMFMAYKNVWMLENEDLLSVLKTCRKLGAVALIHAENGDVIFDNQKKLLEMGISGPEGYLLSRPEEVETEAINRACEFAKEVSCPLYVVHVMSKGASSVLAQKRNEGLVVFGETLVAALASTGLQYFNPCWEEAAGHIVAPPLRPDPTIACHLINQLIDDGLQVVSSDHCGYSTSQKMQGHKDFTKIPVGVNGVEDRMSVTWEKAVCEGYMDPMRFVEITSTIPAKIFNLYPKKGCIDEGCDADIVVWNARKTRNISKTTHNEAVDYNIFEGMKVHGVPEYVFLRGKMVVEKGNVRVVRGMGRFLEILPFSKYVYGTMLSKMPITLYHMPASPPSRAALLAARTVGVDVDIKLVDLLAGEQLKPEFIKINPLHTIPTIDDNGFIVTDSHAIACYLANKYGKDDKLYPKDPKKRALVDQRLYFDATVLHTRLKDICFPVFFLGGNTVPEEKKARVQEALGYLDGYLAPTGWVAGENLTIADCVCAASVTTFVAEGFNLSKYKNVVAWIDRCRTKIPDFHDSNQAGVDMFKELFQSRLLPGQL